MFILTKTSSFPTLYVISQATKGPATWCLQMQREVDNCHTRNSSTVLLVWITGLFPSGCFASFQPREPEAPSLTANFLLSQTWKQFVPQIHRPFYCLYFCLQNEPFALGCLAPLWRQPQGQLGKADNWSAEAEVRPPSARPVPGPRLHPVRRFVTELALQKPSARSPCV